MHVGRSQDGAASRHDQWVDTDSLSIARWQFRMAWGLADHYLDRLTDDVRL